ncbi:MAG: hypothetical protein GHHEDOFH_00861 [Pseudorhodoplanes sp.]|nr:hypothetical protein [Pseudorhodoplanes sp.]
MTLKMRCDELYAGWPGNILIEDMTIDVALRELNYALPIIGRTGRGKSTLLYALSGMAKPVLGSVSWQFPRDEASITWSASERSFKTINPLRRRRFGFLLQDASMIPCFTVAENLRHTLRLRGIRDHIEDRIQKAVRDMLIEAETPDGFLNKYPSRLSGGMRQRMALAAAIAHDPAVLFADEPTASLDDKSGLEVLSVIRRWLEDGSGERAFVFVTHRIETLSEGIGARMALELRLPKENSTAKIEATWRPIEAGELAKTA